MNEPYIQALRDAIKRVHKCTSRYSQTVAVAETVPGKTPWQGDVEVFDLAGHASARQCYAWRYKDEAGHWQYVLTLKTAAIDSAKGAVRAFLVNPPAPQA